MLQQEEQRWEEEQLRRYTEALWQDMVGNFRNVPCQIDMEDLEAVPLSRERALGLQQELSDRLSSLAFQQQLRECERTYGKDTLDFRREHQQLVLGLQSTVLPKYGYEASLEGVTKMLKDFEVFADDPEVSGNITAIDSLIWKYQRPGDQRKVAPRPARRVRPRDAPSRQREGQLRLYAEAADEQRQEGEAQAQEAFLKGLLGAPRSQSAPPPAAGASAAQLVAYQGLPVEIDMDDIRVPLSKELALSMQAELCGKLGEPSLQRQLRECARRHGTSSLEFRRERQQLVLGVQSHVLPKYGFEASLDGVAAMLAAVDALWEDPEVSSNAEELEGLLWIPGGHRGAAGRRSAQPGGPTPQQRPAPLVQPNAGHQASLDWHIGRRWLHRRRRQRQFLAGLEPLWEAPAEVEDWAGAEAWAEVVVADEGGGCWVVAGGEGSGGLITRPDEGMGSKQMFETEVLAVGSIVQEIQTVGSLMYFVKLAGSGPESGWVSITPRGTSHFEAYTGSLPGADAY